MTPQETNPDLPISVQESLVEAWVGGGLLQDWDTEYSSACMGPFHYLHHSLASGQIIPTKVRLVKAMVFPVVMCGCESWTVKKAEH